MGWEEARTSRTYSRNDKTVIRPHFSTHFWGLIDPKPVSSRLKVLLSSGVPGLECVSGECYGGDFVLRVKKLGLCPRSRRS